MEQEDQNGPDGDGVDVTLIRWFLSLSPAERLQVVQNYANSILSIRERNARG